MWFPAYLFGLQMTHIDRGFMQEWYFTIDQMRKWGVGLWSLTAATVALVGYNTYYLYLTYSVTGIFWYYLGVFWGEVLFMVLVTLYYSYCGDKTFHLHHYTIAMIGISVLGY